MSKNFLGRVKVNGPENENEILLARQESAKNDDFENLWLGILDKIEDHFPESSRNSGAVREKAAPSRSRRPSKVAETGRRS